MEQLQYMTDSQLQHVTDFTVGCRDLGEVRVLASPDVVFD